MECKPRFFRFHNNNDIVTKVPVRLMGYSHIGRYLYTSEEKEIQLQPGFWFWFIDYVDGALNDVKTKGMDAITDHDIQEYLEAIEKWDKQ